MCHGLLNSTLNNQSQLVKSHAKFLLFVIKYEFNLQYRKISSRIGFEFGLAKSHVRH